MTVELEKWATTVPSRMAMAVVSRSCLRSIPLLSVRRKWRSKFAKEQRSTLADGLHVTAAGEFLLGSFQASALAWAIAAADEVPVDIKVAAKKIIDKTSKNSEQMEGTVQRVATALTYCAMSAVASLDHRDEPGNAVFGRLTAQAIGAAGFAGQYRPKIRREMDRELERDIKALEQASAEAIIREPLWSNEMPDDLEHLLADLKKDCSDLQQGFDVWLNWYTDRLRGKPFRKAVDFGRIDIPGEIAVAGTGSINAHLKRLVSGAARRPLNRARAIFIGHGQAGKTTLIRALQGLPFRDSEARTSGVALTEGPANVDVTESKLGKTSLTVHYWDFGGQVIVHHTHQFFMRSNCLYVLVMPLRLVQAQLSGI